VTLRAVLTAPPVGDPSAHVAGLPILLRQLLSLQDAGVDEVEVEGIADSELPHDSRLTLRVVPAPVGAARDSFLRARIGLVWHRLVPARLVRAGFRGDIEAAPLEPGEFVVAPLDAGQRRVAEDLLLASLIKATDGLISRTINRRISLRVTRSLLETPLTPNQMTGVASVFGLAAIVVVAWGGAAWFVPGAVLLQLQSILDGCDGEISRLKYIRSRLGEWLDQVADDLVNLGFFVATGWALHLAGWGPALTLTVIGTALHLIYQGALYTALVVSGGGSGSVASIRWRGQKDHGETPYHDDGEPWTVFKWIKETLEMAGRRDFFTFLYLPAALLGMMYLALAWCTGIFALSGAASGVHWLIFGAPSPARKGSAVSGSTAT
jgi:phosphatidylglycerophosphate synthase